MAEILSCNRASGFNESLAAALQAGAACAQGGAWKQGGQGLAQRLAQRGPGVVSGVHPAEAAFSIAGNSQGVRRTLKEPIALEIPCSIHLSYGREGVFCVSGGPLLGDL